MQALAPEAALGRTLRAAPGFHPTLTMALTAATPTDPNGKAGYQINLEGLTFESDAEGAAPMVQVIQQSASTRTVEVVNDTVIGHSAAVINPVAASLRRARAASSTSRSTRPSRAPSQTETKRILARRDRRGLVAQ